MSWTEVLIRFAGSVIGGLIGAIPILILMRRRK